MTRSTAIIGSALCALIAGSATARAEMVGSAGAVNTTTTGAAPGGGDKVIEIGAQIVRNERIKTSKSGSMQVMFIDKTSLNIGPDSSLVIDEYVYNPADRTGQMAIRLGKGVLRIVGGQVTHTGGATVETPTATMGIRGGAATISHATSQQCATACTRAFLHFGQITVTPTALVGTSGATQTILRPGFGVTVNSANTPASPIVRVSSSEIGDLNRNLTSKPTQTGGTSNIPSDSGASKFGVGNVANVDPGNVNSRQPQTTSSSTSSSSSSTTSSVNQTVQSAQQTAQQGSQNATSNTTSQNSPQPPSGPTLPAHGPAAFVLTTSVDPSLGQTTYPFLTASFVISGGASVVTPILAYRVANAAGSQPAKANWMQASITVNGNGAAQSSMISVATGLLGPDPGNGDTMAGGFVASSMPSATAFAKRATGGVSSTPNSITTDANALPTGTYGINQNSFYFSANGAGTYVPQSAETNATGAIVNYNFNQTVTAGATPPPSLGVNRPTATLQGYASGFLQTTRFDSTGAVAVTTTNPMLVTGNVGIGLDANRSTMGAIVNLAPAYTYSGGNAGLAANSITSAGPIFRFGSTQASTNAARSAYIDINNFAARSETFVVSPGVQNDTSSMNAKVFNQAAQPGGFADTVNSTFVVSDAVGANSSAALSQFSTATVTPCDCDYTKWGFWSVNAWQNDSANAAGYLTRGNLNTWVAGIPANAVDRPLTGTATYSGAVVANIWKNQLPSGVNPPGYLATGTFSNVVNFGTGTGLVSIGNLDGANYSGTVGLAVGGTTFGGSLTGTLGRTASVFGQFYQGGPTNILPKFGEMGGGVALSGPSSYVGVGSFAAKLTTLTP